MRNALSEVKARFSGNVFARCALSVKGSLINLDLLGNVCIPWVVFPSKRVEGVLRLWDFMTSLALV